MADTNPYPQPIEEVLAEFNTRRDLLSDFCVKTKDLVEECLQDAKIRYQSVQARVKTSKKLREKYLNPDKHYTRLDDITDLAGLRVITYYEDEVDMVAEVIRREFDLDENNSVDKRKTEPDRFGYYAVNYVCRHSKERCIHIPYRKFSSVTCEIQITSILRHAWSEIQHDWYDLRDAFPDGIKRRFSRIAALLEIAESEFLDLRKGRQNYLQSVDLQVVAEVPDVPLDPLSLRSFILLNPVVGRIDHALAAHAGTHLSDELSDRLLSNRCARMIKLGFTTIRELFDSLTYYEPRIIEYFSRSFRFAPDAPYPRGLSRGTSIFHLASMITCSRAEDGASLLSEDFVSGSTTGDSRRQIAIAREIMARPSGGGHAV